jgi:hypothetical protein
MTDWTNPRTWSIGELVTKAIMDTHLRDNLNYLKEQLDLIGDLSTTLKLIKRQGGSSTDWTTAGTTSYTPSLPKVQVGSVSFSVPSSTVTMYTDITFPTAFTYKPLVYVSLNSDTESATTGATPPVCYGENATSTTVRIRIKGNGNMYPSTVTVAWMAIGT